MRRNARRSWRLWPTPRPAVARHALARAGGPEQAERAAESFVLAPDQVIDLATDAFVWLAAQRLFTVCATCDRTASSEIWR